MTKVRPPLTFENALTRVAGLIGWGEVARICGCAESTVRNWSDQDTTAKLPLEGAFRLDVAYRAAGGDDAPFLTCYATRVDTEFMDVSADRRELVACVARAARESGEAIEATLAAADPSATAADLVVAEREVEEAIGTSTSILSQLRALARPLMNRPGS
jgi:hypothetical protein